MPTRMKRKLAREKAKQKENDRKVQPEALREKSAMEPKQSKYIFISYKSEEFEYAERLHKMLESLGFSVWWDRSIQTGKAWNEEIDLQLANASCVIVLWSRRSAESKWIAYEAAHAIARGVYVPCCIENVNVPIPYNRLQAAQLFGWNGSVKTAGFPSLIARISEVLQGTPLELQTEMTFSPWPEKVHRSLPAVIYRWVVMNLIGLVAIGITVAVMAVVFVLLNQQLTAVDSQTFKMSALVDELRQEAAANSKELLTHGKTQIDLLTAVQGQTLTQQIQQLRELLIYDGDKRKVEDGMLAVDTNGGQMVYSPLIPKATVEVRRDAFLKLYLLGERDFSNAMLDDVQIAKDQSFITVYSGLNFRNATFLRANMGSLSFEKSDFTAADLRYAQFPNGSHAFRGCTFRNTLIDEGNSLTAWFPSLNVTRNPLKDSQNGNSIGLLLIDSN